MQTVWKMRSGINFKDRCLYLLRMHVKKGYTLLWQRASFLIMGPAAEDQSGYSSKAYNTVDKYLSPVSGNKTTISLPAFSGLRAICKAA